MSEAAAQKLLADLIDAATAPGLRYAHAWRKGDVVMWDNWRPCIAAGLGRRRSRG